MALVGQAIGISNELVPVRLVTMCYDNSCNNIRLFIYPTQNNGEANISEQKVLELTKGSDEKLFVFYNGVNFNFVYRRINGGRYGILAYSPNGTIGIGYVGYFMENNETFRLDYDPKTSSHYLEKDDPLLYIQTVDIDIEPKEKRIVAVEVPNDLFKIKYQSTNESEHKHLANNNQSQKFFINFFDEHGIAILEITLNVTDESPHVLIIILQTQGNKTCHVMQGPKPPTMIMDVLKARNGLSCRSAIEPWNIPEATKFYVNINQRQGAKYVHMTVKIGTKRVSFWNYLFYGLLFVAFPLICIVAVVCVGANYCFN